MKKLVYILLILFLIACQKNGVIEEVDPTGDVCFNTYKGGELDGLSTCYYYNSNQKKSESTYNEGTRKNHEEWHEDGVKSIDEWYLDIKSDSPSHLLWWWSNGNKNLQIFYDTNGFQTRFTMFQKNGEIYEDCKYKDGKKTGRETLGKFSDTNEFYVYAHYNWKEGKKDSIQWQYDKYGRVEKGENYIAGKRIVSTKWEYTGKNDKIGALVSKECWDIYGNKKECN